jgi:hypothetical protein
LIAHIESRIYGRFTGVVVQQFHPEELASVPRMHLVFRHPAWSPRVVVSLVSENLVSFKVVLTWQEHGRLDPSPATVGSFLTSIMKVRVHGLAFEREVLVPGDAASGFVVIESQREWDKLAYAVCLYLHYAGEFSATIQQ